MIGSGSAVGQAAGGCAGCRVTFLPVRRSGLRVRSRSRCWRKRADRPRPAPGPAVALLPPAHRAVHVRPRAARRRSCPAGARPITAGRRRHPGRLSRPAGGLGRHRAPAILPAPSAPSRDRHGQSQRPRSPPPAAPGHYAHDSCRPAARIRLVQVAPRAPGTRPIPPLPATAPARPGMIHDQVTNPNCSTGSPSSPGSGKNATRLLYDCGRTPGRSSCHSCASTGKYGLLSARTNAIESINARLRRTVNARGYFPTEQAAIKCLYLAIMSLDPTGRGRKRWTNRWKAALNALDSTFDGRLSAGRQQNLQDQLHRRLDRPGLSRRWVTMSVRMAARVQLRYDLLLNSREGGASDGRTRKRGGSRRVGP